MAGSSCGTMHSLPADVLTPAPWKEREWSHYYHLYYHTSTLLLGLCLWQAPPTHSEGDGVLALSEPFCQSVHFLLQLLWRVHELLLLVVIASGPRHFLCCSRVYWRRQKREGEREGGTDMEVVSSVFKLQHALLERSLAAVSPVPDRNTIAIAVSPWNGCPSYGLCMRVVVGEREQASRYLPGMSYALLTYMG